MCEWDKRKVAQGARLYNWLAGNNSSANCVFRLKGAPTSCQEVNAACVNCVVDRTPCMVAASDASKKVTSVTLLPFSKSVEREMTLQTLLSSLSAMDLRAGTHLCTFPSFFNSATSPIILYLHPTAAWSTSKFRLNGIHCSRLKAAHRFPSITARFATSRWRTSIGNRPYSRGRGTAKKC